MAQTVAGGIDADGFILPAPTVRLQPQFQALLDDACASLAQSGPLLDGIYLYGSIARGDARPGVSDLDLTLVLRDPPAAQEMQTLEAVRVSLEARHPEVIKIDFDIGWRTEVLAPENRFSWGYWLKHHCRCLWGNDLTERFEPFRPSLAIAKAVNADFEATLTRYATLIDNATSDAASCRLQREASRKLVRATHVLRPEHELRWPQTLDEHVELFVQRYPSLQPQADFFLSQAKKPACDETFSTRLREFLAWMVTAV